MQTCKGLVAGLAMLGAVELLSTDSLTVQKSSRGSASRWRVELRFFGGLSTDEVADALGVSTKTVLRDWQLAKMWLFRELGGRADQSETGQP